MEFDYEEALQRARLNLPESVHLAERFEVPNVRGHIEGNKTVISNMQQIADTLGRPLEHILKFTLKELATPGIARGQLVALGTKVAASRINDKIKQYARLFVICSECGKPDTKLTKEGSISIMQCTACGARKPISSKI
jgi:translation initiation factor 2 subunit 2